MAVQPRKSMELRGEPRVSATSQSTLTEPSSSDSHLPTLLTAPAPALPSRFQTQVELCKTVFRVPYAVVVLSEAEQAWYTSVGGLGIGQTPLQNETAGSLTDWLLGSTDPPASVRVWADASADPELAGASIIAGPPWVKFYARTDLLLGSSRTPLGHLCIADREARSDFDAMQRGMLTQFADLVLKELEHAKAAFMQTVVAQHQMLASPASPLAQTLDSFSDGPTSGLARAADCFQEATALVVTGEADGWRVVHANAALCALAGLPPEAMPGRFSSVLQEQPGKKGEAPLPQLQAPFSGAYNLKQRAGLLPVWVEFRPAATRGEDGLAQSLRASQALRLSQAPTASQSYFAIVRPEARGEDVAARGPGGARAAEGEDAAAVPSPPASISSLPTMRKPKSSVFSDVHLGPLIGRGAYGRVFRGTWYGNTVAVKVMETDNPEVDVVSEDGVTRKAGLFEAALSSSISHPNVAHTYMYAVREAPLPPLRQPSPSMSVTQDGGASEVHGTDSPKTDGDTGGSSSRNTQPSSSPTRRAVVGPAKRLHEVWIVSEFCNLGPILTGIERGVFLTQPYAAHGQPNLVAILQTLQEIAAALAYLHANDILHGDLTGGNILLASSTKDGRGFSAKVVDFGLSRIIGGETYLRTRTLGCAEYMPPELITEGLMTRAGDVYAFGVVMWELYMGQRAWDGLSTSEVLNLVASKQRLLFPPNTPHRLRLLGTRCLAFRQEDRPSFSDILVEVESILQDTHTILRSFLARHGQA